MGLRRLQTRQYYGGQSMIRFFLIVIAAGVIIIGAAVVMLGTYPPNPVTHPVEKTLPNDKFQGH